VLPLWALLAMEEQVAMNKQVAVDAQAVVDKQAVVDQKAVVRGSLPRSVVEAIAVPYRPINVPFKSTVYQTLFANQCDIRLLEVKFSAHYSDPVCCNLISFSLSEEPEYAALFDETSNLITSSLNEKAECSALPPGNGFDIGKTGHLELNGHRFTTKESVISSIRQFLAAARASGYSGAGKAVRLWSDACCINQVNLSETNSQVQLMREIYAKAKVVWACSKNPKDTALATAVDPKEMMKVGSRTEDPKFTTLAGRLPAQSRSKPTRTAVYPREILGMPNLTGGLLNFPAVGSGIIAAPPPQPGKLRHDLGQDMGPGGIYSTKTLKTNLEDIEKPAEQDGPSRASLRDGMAPYTADPFGVKSMFRLPQASNVQIRPYFPNRTGSVQRGRQVRPFEYRPIKTDREIRLLQIDKQIEGFLCTFKYKLVHAQLGDPSYPYNAVSYTWGDPTPTHSLIVDCNQCLRVTENVRLLVNFLFMGMDFGTSFFWIDAVCINQADLEEKSSQVSLMRDIYQHAGLVKIWLGQPLGSYEEKAIEDLQRLQKFFKLYEENNDKYGVIMSERAKRDARSNIEDKGTVWLEEVMPDGSVRMRRPSMAETLQRHMTPAMIEARFRLHYGKELPTDWNWGHISMLFSKPWFERVWVIQEAFAGSRVLIHCGGKVMPWEDFNFVTSRLMLCGLDLSIHHGTGDSDETAVKTVSTGLTNSIFIDALKVVKAEKRALRLAPLLLTSSRYQATNPRDKVYSLLGISSESKHSDLMPNYSLSAGEVFIKTAIHLIREDESLELLAAAGIGWHRETPNLPSWVPDFKSPPELPRWRFELCGDSYATSAHKSKTISTAQAIPGTHTLVVNGVLVDEVIRVGPLPCPQPQTAKVVGAAAYMVERNNTMWFWQARFMCDSLKQYPTKEPLLEVYWRTLIMNVSHEGLPATPNYGASYNRVAAVLGKPVEYQNSHREERSDLAMLMDELANHGKADAVTVEFAYMERESKNSKLELGRRWNQAYASNGAGRNVFITRRGYFGIAAPGVEKGDQVALFSGVVTPMILRGAESSEREAATKLGPAYNLVSESYIHGLMSGGGLNVGEMHDICLY
jgi:hypothetical protein